MVKYLYQIEVLLYIILASFGDSKHNRRNIKFFSCQFLITLLIYSRFLVVKNTFRILTSTKLSNTVNCIYIIHSGSQKRVDFDIDDLHTNRILSHSLSLCIIRKEIKRCAQCHRISWLFVSNWHFVPSALNHVPSLSLFLHSLSFCDEIFATGSHTFANRTEKYA